MSEAGPETIRRAHAVRPLAAVQSEYSPWARHLEARVPPPLRELRIGLVPFAPLGRGFLTGEVRSETAFAEGDFRRDNPPFTGGNFRRNLRIADEVVAGAAEADATPARGALAWLLSQDGDIAPLPGTKRVDRVEENTAADRIELAAAHIEKLNSLPAAAGATHHEAGMQLLER
ncbi:aldo/keto reductase [Streptomyces sp. 769]|nr:aldo/keto reductase [Streptomyces sp. 769]